MLVFRDFGVAAKDLHKGTQCSIAFNKSCSQRRSTSSRTDRFFSGNNRQSKSREPGGTTPLAASDNCKFAVKFSSGRAVSSFAKNYSTIYIIFAIGNINLLTNRRLGCGNSHTKYRTLW